MLARKGAVSTVLNVLQRTSNKRISCAPFTSAADNDFKARRWSEDVKEGVNKTTRQGASMDERAYGRGDRSSSSVAESLKDGVAKAMETGINVGEKMKQGMDEAWDATKETTKNVKDAVVDDANDAMKKGYDYPPNDSHVDSLRKRADGYDNRRN